MFTNIKPYIPIQVLLFLCINGCFGKSDNGKDCDLQFHESKKLLNHYYQSKDKNDLKLAMQKVDSSLSCSNTRTASIEIKLSILSLLKEYKQAYELVDSLPDRDFIQLKPYKKLMYSYYFKALYYKTISDTDNSRKYFNFSQKIIEKYISQSHYVDNNMDEDVYYDLFFIEAQYVSPEELSNEIHILQKQYPSHKDFFNLMLNINAEKSMNFKAEKLP